MIIRNTEFDFDILRPADAARWQHAADAMQATAQALPRTANVVESLQNTAAVLDSFFAELLGEDYDTRLGIDPGDLRALKGMYQEMLAAVQQDLSFNLSAPQQAPAALAASPAQAAQPVPPMPFDQMNRAQRRAWVRSLKGGK